MSLVERPPSRLLGFGNPFDLHGGTRPKMIRDCASVAPPEVNVEKIARIH
jgi:hypothetical protein